MGKGTARKGQQAQKETSVIMPDYALRQKSAVRICRLISAKLL